MKIVVACWIASKDEGHEVVELDEDGLLDLVRGAATSAFETPPNEQSHWEVVSVQLE